MKLIEINKIARKANQEIWNLFKDYTTFKNFLLRLDVIENKYNEPFVTITINKLKKQKKLIENNIKNIKLYHKYVIIGKKYQTNRCSWRLNGFSFWENDFHHNQLYFGGDGTDGSGFGHNLYDLVRLVQNEVKVK